MEKDFLDKFNRPEILSDKFLRKVFEEGAVRQSFENFVELLEAAEKHGLSKISLNEMEIIDPDKTRDYNSKTWPAIWAVSRECNLKGGAGNNGQHQIDRGYFLPEYFGTWDIKNRIKIGKAKSLFGKDLGTDERVNLEKMNGESCRS